MKTPVMAKYHPRIPFEAQEAYLRDHLDPEELRAVDIQTIFGEPDQLVGDRFRRRLDPKPNLDEIEDPRRQGEDD